MVQSQEHGRVTHKAMEPLTRGDAGGRWQVSACPTRITQKPLERTSPGKQLLERVWDFKVRIL